MTNGGTFKNPEPKDWVGNGSKMKGPDVIHMTFYK